MEHEEATPGSVRPGGRTARVREAVLRVAGDLLAVRGFAHLDLAEVAARAEVGKTTVYRRWRTPAGLVTDLLADMAEQSLPHADTGSLLGDLTANARLVASALTDPRQGRLFQAVIAAATCDETAATALRRFYDIRLTEWAPCVAAAIQRGEAPLAPTPVPSCPRFPVRSITDCSPAATPSTTTQSGQPRWPPAARRGPGCSLRRRKAGSRPP